MCNEDVVITVKPEEAEISSEKSTWDIVSDASDVVMSIRDYEAIELTICDTEGE